MLGSAKVEKPSLPDDEEASGAPEPREERDVHWGERFVPTPIYRLEDVEAGQTIEGPAVVEHSATTFTVPPGRSARLDRHHIFHLGDAG